LNELNFLKKKCNYVKKSKENEIISLRKSYDIFRKSHKKTEKNLENIANSKKIFELTKQVNEQAN